jgi:arsenate reductase (thioredoxin)
MARATAKALFVCVENSCRSQIAEGFARALGGDILSGRSAGSKPSGVVNPKAVESMRRRGIDISGHVSKGLSELSSSGWDYVVTMGCGDACPFVPARARLDWNIPDPKHMPPEEFDRVRDEIEARVRALLADAAGPSGRR